MTGSLRWAEALAEGMKEQGPPSRDEAAQAQYIALEAITNALIAVVYELKDLTERIGS